MLDIPTYRLCEKLSKANLPSWRIAQTHNVDHFMRVGFPVRMDTLNELTQLLDTMQENRFDDYMRELGGFTKNDLELFLKACRDILDFQMTFFSHRPPVLPLSTLISVFALYKKMLGFRENFQSVLEVGPGCGYLSFFLKHHIHLKNYSQIEACESFYLLQSLVNTHTFSNRFVERAVLESTSLPFQYFSNFSNGGELSPVFEKHRPEPVCYHYPWWRIGELANSGESFDMITSNANLLEFRADALDDYLTLYHRLLNKNGIFLVQCTGFTAHGTLDGLLHTLHAKGFAMVMFVEMKAPASLSDEATTDKSSFLGRLIGKKASGSGTKAFATNNALLVKEGHPLFSKYYERSKGSKHFIAKEDLIAQVFFQSNEEKKRYSLNDALSFLSKSLT